MVLGDALDRASRLVAEDDEVAEEVEKPSGFEHSADQDLELRHLGDDLATVDGLPRCVVLEARRERAHHRTQPIRGNADRVGGEDRRDVLAVGLQLVPGAFECGVLIACVLEFDEPHGQPVHEHDNVGSPVLSRLDNRVLVHDNEVVLREIAEIDQPGERVSDAARVFAILERDAFRDQPMQAQVLRGRVL